MLIDDETEVKNGYRRVQGYEDRKAKAGFKPRCSSSVFFAPTHQALPHSLLLYGGVTIYLTVSGCFKIFAFTRKATVNIFIPISLCIEYHLKKHGYNALYTHSYPKQSLCCSRTQKRRKSTLS